MGGMRKKTGLRSNPQSRAVMSGMPESKHEEEALGTRIEQYRTMFEGMLEGAFFQAADGRLTDVNTKALQIFGLTREEFLSRTSHSPSWKVIREDGSLLPGDEHPSMVALKTGLPVTDKTVGVFNIRTNAYVWVIVNGVPLFRPSESTPYQVCVTLHDITEHKQVADELRQSEERYRMLTETAPDGIITANGQGCIVSWNHGAEKIYGFKAEEIIGQDCVLLMPEDQREQHAKIFAMLIKAGKPLTSDLPAEGIGRRKDGALFPVEQTFNFHWANNEPFFTIIVRDISRRKEIEKSLHVSEERLRLILENSPIGICIFDKNGVMIQANSFCEKCFGRSMDELTRQGLPMFLHPDDCEKTTQTLLTLVNNHEMKGEIVVIENRYFAADGRTVYTKQHLQGCFDKTGSLSFVIVLTEDITAAKQLTLMNSAIINKLKDLHSQLKEFNDFLPDNKKFLSTKSLSDYGLSPMENRIASMLFHGNANKKIAHHLCISENTVKHHITSIYSKFNVKNRIAFLNAIRINHLVI